MDDLKINLPKNLTGRSGQGRSYSFRSSRSSTASLNKAKGFNLKQKGFTLKNMKKAFRELPVQDKALVFWLLPSSILGMMGSVQTAQGIVSSPLTNQALHGGIFETWSGYSELMNKKQLRAGIGVGYLARGLSLITMGLFPRLAEWLTPYWFTLSFFMSASYGRDCDKLLKNKFLKTGSLMSELKNDISAMLHFIPKFSKTLVSGASWLAFLKNPLLTIKNNPSTNSFLSGWLGIFSGLFALIGQLKRKAEAKEVSLEERNAQTAREETNKNTTNNRKEHKPNKYESISFVLGKVAATVLSLSYLGRSLLYFRNKNLLLSALAGAMTLANWSFLFSFQNHMASQVSMFVSIILSRLTGVVERRHRRLVTVDNGKGK